MLQKKKPFKCACTMARTVQFLRHEGYCPFTFPISAEIRTVDSQSDLRILL